MWHHMGRGFMGRGFMGFGGGSIVMMGFWLLIIVGIITFLVKHFNNNASNNSTRNYNSNPKEDSLEIARKRYAKGEINKEEFQEIKEELKD